MEKLRLQTTPYSRWSRLGSMGQRVYGRMNYSVSCGHIRQWLAHLQGRHLFALYLEVKLLYQQKLDWPAIEYPTIMKKGMNRGCAYSWTFLTKSEWPQNSRSLVISTWWWNTTTPKSSLVIFRSETWFLGKWQWPLETSHRASWAQIGKDPTGSSTNIENRPTT